MAIRRRRAAAAVVKGKMYVLGGFNNNQCLSTTERFDPETSTWEALSPMTEKRDSVAGVAASGAPGGIQDSPDRARRVLPRRLGI